jgi:hypothetical protein
VISLSQDVGDLDLEKGRDQMATYTVRRSKHATLVAATADSVTLTGRPTSVELRNFDSTAVIFYRVDGVARL